MLRVTFIFLLCGLFLVFKSSSQSLTSFKIPDYTYYHPSKDKEAWQRLNLLLSSTYIVVVKEGQVDHDTCLYLASRSLGLSRFAVLAEGFGDEKLREQSRWIDERNPAEGRRLLSNSSGNRHLQLLLLLGSYYAFEPMDYRDSAEYLLNKTVDESRRLKEEHWGRQALCLLGKIYVQANDTKGDSIFNFLLSQCSKAGDKRMEAKAYAYRGMYTAPTPASFGQKLTDLQKASELYRELKNIEGQINVITDLGYMFIVTGQLALARESFLKALSLAEIIQYPYLHYITDALTMVTVFEGKFGEPFRYAIQTIKSAENCRDSIGWAYFYSRISELYESEGRISECDDMVKKAINRFINDKNPSVYGILNMAVARMCSKGQGTEALQLIGNISKKIDPSNTVSEMFAFHSALSLCYLALHKLDSAELHIKKMDSVEAKAEQIRGTLRRTLIMDRLGELSFKRGHYQKAKEYLEKHFTTPGQHTLLNDLAIYPLLILSDSILGNNASALSHYRKYTQLLDSNFRVTKVRQAEELQVMYETKEKESQISLLNEQALLEKANLKQATVVKNLILAGGIVVVIIAVLLYRQNSLRKKNNTVISESNKEIKNKNEQLQQLVADKEWLLREIHHRVKNNLQIVMSLLNSQSVYINNDAALTALQDSQRRVYAMSLIHQKLYQSDNIATIAMREYINDLVTHLQESFTASNRIVFTQDIDSLELDVTQAIPLGLIINESVVNAIKYAFPDGQKGSVMISLQFHDDDHLCLGISDNGIGLPIELDTRASNSLGLDLIRGLTQQLDGDITISNNNGLHLSLLFPLLSKQISEGPPSKI